MGQASTPATVEVLLLEDNPADAAIVTRALTRSTDAIFRVRHADRLSQVEERLRGVPVDLIVTDLTLPDSSDQETVRALRRLAPSLPVVVLSGNDNQDVRLAALRLGALDFVPKEGSPGLNLSLGLLYALARAQRQTRIYDIVEYNSDGAVVVDMDGTILFVNRAACEMFGRPRDELEGSRFGFPITGQGAVEIEILDVSGRSRTAEMRVVQLNWGTIGVNLASIRDITDRKRSAELERRLIHADRLASIGQLAAGVAHEINNPANFVQANCILMADEVRALEEGLQILSQRLTDKFGVAGGAAFNSVTTDFSRRLRDVREMLTECDSGMRRISATVKDLSTFARIEGADIDFCDLNQLALGATNMVRSELRHRARLITQFEELPLVAVDPARITQLMVNLLLNAIHAIDEGGGSDNTIRVESRLMGDAIYIAIEDTGCGISSQHRAHIFEPFYTTKPRDRGTGLGLSLAAETVRKHLGTITVDSVVGGGSRFEVRLPVDTGLAPAPALKKAHNPPPSSSSRARILVIDDEPFLRRAFRRILGDHEVLDANGGVAALALLESDRDFDVIICDLMMPDMDGTELHAHISKMEPELAKRIVFVTGGAVTKRTRQFVAAHHSVVLEKPVSRETLHEVVERTRRT